MAVPLVDLPLRPRGLFAIRFDRFGCGIVSAYGLPLWLACSGANGLARFGFSLAGIPLCDDKCCHELGNGLERHFTVCEIRSKS